MNTAKWLGVTRAMTTLGVVLALTVLTTNVPVLANSAPDLEVGTPSVDDSSPYTTASFTLSATVTNAGDGESAPTTLRYYRSTDAMITTSDTELGTDSVGALAPSGSSDQSIDLTAASTAGTYYYGACVDSVTGESDTSDNCSASVTVTVKARPDLRILGGTQHTAPLVPGGRFTLTARVNNVGSGASSATTVRYYRYEDDTVTTSDTELGTDSVDALASGGYVNERVELTAPASPGTYYYGACVDSVSGESETTNNCTVNLGDGKGHLSIVVSEPGRPNLRVHRARASDSNLVAGETFTLSARVLNGGSGESPATTLRYYRSTDSTITTSDAEEGTDSVGAITGGSASAQSIDLTAPSTAGRYYYGVCVDTVANETNTTDNCQSSGTQVTVSPAPIISGTAQVGQTLTANTSDISDPDGLTNPSYSYQWLADDTEIDGATSSTYTVQSTDNGKVIKVRVTFTDDGGNEETLTSAGTAAAVQPALTVSGSTTTNYAENGTGTVATYAATGALPGATINWSLSGDDSDDFSINSSGALSFKVSPNYESPSDSNTDNMYSVTVEASATGRSPGTLDVTVTVTDVNEGPLMSGG